MDDLEVPSFQETRTCFNLADVLFLKVLQPKVEQMVRHEGGPLHYTKARYLVSVAIRCQHLVIQ